MRTSSLTSNLLFSIPPPFLLLPFLDPWLSPASAGLPKLSLRSVEDLLTICAYRRTCALVSISGTISQLCLPHFDSPSVFARILDKNHGGHFGIHTTTKTSSKQQYLPSTNILATKFLSDKGVGQIDDYMPLPASKNSGEFLPWVVRHVTTIRGSLEYEVVRCSPSPELLLSHTDRVRPAGVCSRF